MSIKAVNFSLPVPVRQADAVLSQANPVSGTAYAVLAATRNAKIYGAYAMVTWTVQPNPLELHVTIDGNAITHSQANPVTATAYLARTFTPNPEATQIMTTSNETWGFHTFYEGRSIAITAETTGGTVQNLDARVKYGAW